ncbi:MAG: hypothetical protein JNL38_37845 [Myxococcales bacterium]|nr:hypothetical protein [Myxococcales bacterium]
MSETPGAGTDARPPPPRRRALTRVADLGAAAQASIPAIYAWGMTVAPAAWSRGAPALAKVTALLGVAAVAGAAVAERAYPRWARIVSVWGLVVTSVATWALASTAMTPARLDVARGVLGAAGWMFFAFASSAPPVRRREEDGERILDGPPLKPRGLLPRLDSLYLGGAVVVALGMIAIGWRVTSPERGVLVRLVSLASGLAVVGAATEIALARHAPRVKDRPRVRLRRGTATLVLLLVLAGLGAVVLLTR